jgi:hypothetical protein
VVRRARHERIYSQSLRFVQSLAAVQGLTPVQGSKFKVQRNIQSGSRRSRNCHARSQRELPRFENSRNVDHRKALRAVKILEEDAFVITAFFTDEVKGGEQIWPKG